MEALLLLTGIILIVFIVSLPFIVVIRIVRGRRAKRKREAEWSELLRRVHALEQQVINLLKLVPDVRRVEQELKRLSESPRISEAIEAVSRIEPEPATILSQPARDAQMPGRVAEGELPKVPPSPTQPLHLGPEAPAPAPEPTRIPGPVVIPLPTTTPPRPATAGKRASIRGVEEALGTNWLNKLGVIILVIGVALGLAYGVKTLGPAGKISVGYLIALMMLAGGVFFEARERWRVFARAGIGGGWALMFYVTWAMNHVQAAKVLDYEGVDLVLLLVVATAMVGHSLKYQSQVVTGLAFLLAFSIINVGHGGAHSLTAAPILAVGLSAVAVRRRWFKLEVFGILAAYLNHLYWLHGINPHIGDHKPFPELSASTALLIAYWLIFRASYVIRRVDNQEKENFSTVAALLNTFLFNGLIAYQGAHPELAFTFFLSVGAVEMALAVLPITRRRRTAFVILSTIGATLLVTAFGYKFSGNNLSVAWLMEAEALFLAGVFSREVQFRRLGMAASSVLALQMIFWQTARLSHLRGQRGVDFSDLRLGLVFALAVFVFYANAHWMPRRWAGLIEGEFEKGCLRVLSYLGGILAMVGVWAICTEGWWAVGWTVLALGLVYSGSRWKMKELSLQASGMAALGCVRSLQVNLQHALAYHSYDWATWRLITVSTVALLLYLCSRWGAVAGDLEELNLSAAYTWVASFLVAFLIWYQLLPVGVALGWAIFGVVLFELGFMRRSSSFRLQAYFALGASFFRMFLVNLNAAGSPGEISPRVYTTVPLALAFFYIYGRLKASADTFLERDRRLKAPSFFVYLGTLTVAALMRFELDSDFVVAAWAALVLALLAIAWRFGERVFLHQGLLLSFVVLFRTILHNFYERSYFPAPFWHGRLVSVGATVLLLLSSLAFAFRLRTKGGKEPSIQANWLARIVAWIGQNPQQVLFFIPFILVTALLLSESPRLVTLAWGVEAVAVFLFALWAGERSYRLTGLGLLLLCVGKIVFHDAWTLTMPGKILTFIGLGIALSGVSFLYTRYRDTLRQFL